MGVIKVETFDFSPTNNLDTYTLSNDIGNLNDGFIRKITETGKGTGRVGNTGSLGPPDVHTGLQLTATDTITAYKGNANQQRMMGEVWRYTGAASGPDEFIVRGRFAVSITGASQSVAVPGIVDRNKCVPIYNGQSVASGGTGDHEDATFACHIDSSDNLVVSKNNTGNLTSQTVYVTVVEFTGSNWTVGHARSASHDSSVEVATLNSDSTGLGGSTVTVSWGNAMIIEASMEGDSSETGIADCQLLVEPGSSGSQVRFDLVELDTGARNDGIAYAHVIGHPSLICNRSRTINFAEGNNSTGTLSFPAGASTSELLEDLSMEWFVGTSGTGSAHGRGRLAARITAASGTITHWVHRSGNNVDAYWGIVEINGIDGTVKPVISSLENTTIPIGGANDFNILGSNFGTNTGLAKVEISDNSTYGVGTLVTQSVDTWTDTDIQIDLVLTGLASDQNLYFWVTDSLGVVSNGVSAFYGNPDAFEIITNQLSATPDHYWSINNVLTDHIQAFDLSVRTGSPGFAAIPSMRGTTHCGFLSGSNQGWDSPDSNFMNLQTETTRQVFFMIRLGATNKAYAAFDEEGGSVNNLMMILAPGNVLTMQLADTGDDNTHAYGNFKLKNNRWYLVWYEFDYNEGTPTFRCGIDRAIQTDSFGNPLTASDLDAHSGNVAVGKTETSNEVFGTDVDFPNPFPLYLAQKITFTSLLPLSEIQDKLFDQCMLSDYTLASDTEANMRTALAAIHNTERPDAPICIDVEPCTEGSFELSPESIEFEDGATIHIRYTGADTLTWVNNGSGNASLVTAPYGGTVVIVNTIITTIQGIPAGAEWRLYVDTGSIVQFGTELDGEESKADGSDVLYSDRYTSDTDVVLQVLADGFEESYTYFTLESTSKTIIVQLDIDNNN